MTKDEIMNMPAGREMDAAIAENVFDWTDIKRDKPLDEYALGKSPYGWHVIPKYSTDIYAAWEVVEKISNISSNTPGDELKFTTLALVHLSPDYAVSFDFVEDAYWWEQLEDDKDSYQYSARGETAPLAICRAALLTTL